MYLNIGLWAFNFILKSLVLAPQNEIVLNLSFLILDGIELFALRELKLCHTIIISEIAQNNKLGKII